MGSKTTIAGNVTCPSYINPYLGKGPYFEEKGRIAYNVLTKTVFILPWTKIFLVLFEILPLYSKSNFNLDFLDRFFSIKPWKNGKIRSF